MFFGADLADQVNSLAAELGEHRIRVNGLDAVGDPDPRDIARATVSLVDGSLSQTTGITIPVYGDLASDSRR